MCSASSAKRISRNSLGLSSYFPPLDLALYGFAILRGHSRKS
jgi:hypothetical protein